jgi:hypothetical protein
MVAMTTAPGPSTKPPAKQALTDGQEIAPRGLSGGTVWPVHVAPPSVVAITTGVVSMTAGA